MPCGHGCREQVGLRACFVTLLGACHLPTLLFPGVLCACLLSRRFSAFASWGLLDPLEGSRCSFDPQANLILGIRQIVHHTCGPGREGLHLGAVVMSGKKVELSRPQWVLASELGREARVSPFSQSVSDSGMKILTWLGTGKTLVSLLDQMIFI